MAEKSLNIQEAIDAGLTVEQFNSLKSRHPSKAFNLNKNSIYKTVTNSDHASFVDSRIIKSPLRKNISDPFIVIEKTRALIVDFFDYYLKK